MIDQKLLEILVCPETHQRVRPAPSELIERLNQLAANKQLKMRNGEPIERRLDGGLLRADEKVLYPIIDGIPVMLVDESIPLEQLP